MLQAIFILSSLASALVTDAGSRQLLDGDWVASSDSLQLRTAAQVPGDLITDLQQAGHIPDPYFETNFLNSSMWNAPDWVYTRTFAVDPALLAPGLSVFLCFDSVKQGGVIKLGGAQVGVVNDQFVRYTFDVTHLLTPGTMSLTVEFDPMIDTHGRFMASTGGWDWAPWSHTWDQTDAPTFSKGLVGSVYLLPARRALLSDLALHTFYLGAHATTALVDGAHAGFRLLVKAHVTALAPLEGKLTIGAPWMVAPLRQSLSLSAGEQVVARNLSVSANYIELWWPLGTGGQQLYEVNVSLEMGGGGEPLQASRLVGFRSLAWVTGNDTDPAWVRANAEADGSASPTFTTLLRVNGARIFARGANMVPIDELEGRVSEAAYVGMVASAAAAGMNMLRVWGGGIFYPDAFYAACDRFGVTVYHDMMYAQEGHAACCGWYGPCWYGRCDLAAAQANCSCESAAGRVQERELRQQIRRLSSHPSIVAVAGIDPEPSSQSQHGPTHARATLTPRASTAPATLASRCRKRGTDRHLPRLPVFRLLRAAHPQPPTPARCRWCGTP